MREVCREVFLEHYPISLATLKRRVLEKRLGPELSKSKRARSLRLACARQRRFIASPGGARTLSRRRRSFRTLLYN
eukprot:1265877-Pleurochrysis_carterae.AAC.1